MKADGKSQEEYDEVLKRFEEEREEYEKEIAQLKAVNQEQKEDLHTMIQSVSELKDCQLGQESQAKLTAAAAHQSRQDHEKELCELRQKSATEINSQIDHIDFLTKKIEQLDDQFAGPKNECLQELQEKSKEMNKLQAELSIKQKDIIGMKSEIERYKI